MASANLPDWASVLTARSTEALAILTAVLVLGVLFAGMQFVLTRKFNRVVETGNILREVAKAGVWEAVERLYVADDLDDSRKRAMRLYGRIEALRGRRAFRALGKRVDDFIDDVARLTERMEIYIRKDMADEGIIAEHIGYHIIVLYIILQDVFQVRAMTQDYNYEGFRDLARRLQDYARLHPLEADLRDALVYAKLPKINYQRGGASRGYSIRYHRLLRLYLIDWWNCK